MDNTMSSGSQLQVIAKKMEAADPKQLPSVEDHVKVCTDRWDTDSLSLQVNVANVVYVRLLFKSSIANC